jgi:hypothetical protein
MISRDLFRRLKRLEESMTPVTVRKVWQIITVNSDGTKEPTGITIEFTWRHTVCSAASKITATLLVGFTGGSNFCRARADTNIPVFEYNSSQ